MQLLKDLRTSLFMTAVTTITLCGVYPVTVWGIAQVVFPREANGSLIETDGKLIGSELLAQGFAAPQYFHPRPSMAGKGYDASSSGGSNLGPTSKKLLDTTKAAAEAYRVENGLAPDASVPGDAVTASASGLDPHISPANAALQAPRVARERNLAQSEVKRLVERYTDRPDLGIFGEAGVNVLLLNLALDRLASGAAPLGPGH
jgi:K+-transporting ATPase ATPase C chain